jgi:hypothetical protein
MAKGYAERFTKVAAEIESNPRLEVVAFKLRPPAAADELRAAEELLGSKLAAPLRRFYSEANGLHLHWRVREDTDPDELSKLREKFDDYDIQLPEDEDIPFAQIRLLGLVESLKRKRWPQLAQMAAQGGEGPFEFRRETYTYRDFGKRLRPFDAFTSYECMAFLLEEGAGDPKVLLLTDYYSEWAETRITDFETYMEFLLATRGISEARKKFFGEYRGDRKQPLVKGADYWTERRVPKLFRGGKKGL